MSPVKPEDLGHASIGSSTGPTSPDGSTPNPNASGRKRRASTTGLRGIANLTPEQLAKKRANDREAQRAIRERTKQQIESLEKRIRELQCQQPYQELQHVIRQKEAVEAENAEIKTRLTTILNIVQPLLADREPDVITPPHQDDQLPGRKYSHGGDPALYKGRPTLAPSPPYVDIPAQQNCSPVASTSSQATWHGTPVTAQGSSTTSTASYMPESITNRQRALASSLSAEKLAYTYYATGHHNALHNPQDERQRGGGPPLPADSHITIATSHVANPLHSVIPNSHGGSFDPVVTLPRNILSTCPLDGLLLDFISERRQRRSEGMPDAEIVGPIYPSFYCLFRPDRGIYTHQLSRFFTDILSTFPDISQPPEKVAVLYIMFLIMRWSISPCQETYNRLPDWVKPSQAQLYTPHPIWIDYLPWPALRSSLVASYHRFPFDNFFVPFTTTVSLNWPYANMSTLSKKPDSEELAINPIFEEHLRDLRNWSLGPAFAKAHPPLAETVRIKEDRATG